MTGRREHDQEVDQTDPASGDPVPQVGPVSPEPSVTADGLANGGGERAPDATQKAWIATYALLLLGLGGLHYAFRLELLGFLGRYVTLLDRLTLAAMAGILVLAIGKLLQLRVLGRLRDPISRYNLTRLLRLAVGLVLAFLVVSILFVNWYAAFVSLGLLSLILGFALQSPITSFIGWIYILMRRPYRVGDRIRIGEATGDVIDVGYLDTTLWEFGGEYLSTDHPSGRLIKFPNSNVFTTAVYNYSWPVFPYIWNEIRFPIAYESDLEWVTHTMLEVVEGEVGAEMAERVREYRRILARTPVDELEVRERPAVFFRPSENTWIEAVVRYLVLPKRAGRVKTRLTNELLERLNAAPERVLFPKGNAR